MQGPVQISRDMTVKEIDVRERKLQTLWTCAVGTTSHPCYRKYVSNLRLALQLHETADISTLSSSCVGPRVNGNTRASLVCGGLIIFHYRRQSVHLFSVCYILNILTTERLQSSLCLLW